MRACQNHYPLIDGRRANCHLAAFGAQKNYPTTPQRGWEIFNNQYCHMLCYVMLCCDNVKKKEKFDLYTSDLKA